MPAMAKRILPHFHFGRYLWGEGSYLHGGFVDSPVYLDTNRFFLDTCYLSTEEKGIYFCLHLCCKVNGFLDNDLKNVKIMFPSIKLNKKTEKILKIFFENTVITTDVDNLVWVPKKGIFEKGEGII